MDQTLTVFFLASLAVILVPGPTVTVIVANSLRAGAVAGWLNIFGTQIGLAMMIVIVAYGLEVITTSLAFIFDWVRLAGAAYLLWLGLRLLRSDGTFGRPESADATRTAFQYVAQGFLVIWSNPKALIFLGAFLPPFVTAGENAFGQTLLLGGLFMLAGILGDGFYAILAGRAGRLLRRERVRLVEKISGTTLIAGALWLAVTKPSAGNAT